MADIFFSYSSKDKARIEPLVNELRERDWSVWWDRELLAGPAFTEKIQQALDEASCVVVAWSENSVASHWCRDEANVGLERNKLVPCRIDDVLPPLGFRSSHTANLAGWPQTAGDLPQLLSAIADCLKVVLPASAVGAGNENEAEAEPSLLVLPFPNRSTDPDQEYFCDGLVEDITTALSQIPEMLVISRSTAFEFKDSKSTPDEIARRIGTKTVLSGSVRTAGNRIRVSALLQEASSGRTLWSETYDRTLDDIFEVQDELTREIVTALDVQLVHGEHARLAGFRSHSLQAAQELYKGMHAYYQYEPSTLIAARHHFKKFIELEPESVLGHAWLSTTWASAMLVQWASPQEALPEMMRSAKKALSIDPDNPVALIAQAMYQLMNGELEDAWETADRAVTSAPNSEEAVFTRGFYEMLLGRSQQSIRSLERAMRLCPVPGSTRLGVTATAYRNVGRYDDSITLWKQLIKRFPDFIFGYSGLASTYALNHQMEEAREMVAEVLKRDPEYSVERFTNPNLYRDKSVMGRVGAALREAGMPES